MLAGRAKDLSAPRYIYVYVYIYIQGPPNNVYTLFLADLVYIYIYIYDILFTAVGVPPSGSGR